MVHGRPGFHINLVMDVSPYCDCHGENDVPMVPNVGMCSPRTWRGRWRSSRRSWRGHRGHRSAGRRRTSFDPVAIDVACADAVNAMPVYIGSALYEARGFPPPGRPSSSHCPGCPPSAPQSPFGQSGPANSQWCCRSSYFPPPLGGDHRHPPEAQGAADPL